MSRVRTATVMFTDLVASTARSVRVGPGQAEELRRDHYGLIRRVVTEHGGAEVKTLGDGVMATFDSVTRAVDAAVGLQQAVQFEHRANPDTPELRVGLSVGEVTEDGTDVHGPCVIEAARVCAGARGHQVLCTAVVRSLAQGHSPHVFRSLGQRDLKGLPDTIAIEEVVWVPLVASGLGADFAHVDDHSAAALACLDLQRDFPLLSEVRRHILELLAPQPGQTFADVGCGAGHDVLALARMVGLDGKVFGIDKSEHLVEEARRRASEQSVTNAEFQVGDALRLPLEDHCVDGVQVDRVLQYVADPARAVRELMRVTRPGGVVVVADTDWGASVYDCDDLELSTRVDDAWTATRPSGRIGRQLYGLFAQAGLREVRVFPHNIAVTDVAPGTGDTTEHARFLGAYLSTFAAQAVEAGAVTAEEASRWVTLQRAAGAEHRFFRFLAMFVVTGRTPVDEGPERLSQLVLRTT